MGRPSSIVWLSTAALLWVGLAAHDAAAHTLAVPYTVERPTLEISSWIAIGGGARASGPGLFDLRLGYDFTLPMARDGDLRIGTFAELGSASFASFAAVGGLELFVAALPRPLGMFSYPGEGALSVRLGAGWGWWSDVPEATSAPVASLTVAYGYRCPFSLREPSEVTPDEPGRRDSARYMIVVRLWTNATLGFADSHVWQLTGGIEFEPVGSFRYILGLY